MATVFAASVSLRPYFSAYHLWAAKRFAKLADAIEHNAEGFDIENRAFVTGAVLAAAAFSARGADASGAMAATSLAPDSNPAIGHAVPNAPLPFYAGILATMAIATPRPIKPSAVRSQSQR
jgi:hypothetical protein